MIFGVRLNHVNEWYSTAASTSTCNPTEIGWRVISTIHANDSAPPPIARIQKSR